MRGKEWHCCCAGVHGPQLGCRKGLPCEELPETSCLPLRQPWSMLAQQRCHVRLLLQQRGGQPSACSPSGLFTPGITS